MSHQSNAPATAREATPAATIKATTGAVSFGVGLWERGWLSGTGTSANAGAGEGEGAGAATSAGAGSGWIDDTVGATGR